MQEACWEPLAAKHPVLPHHSSLLHPRGSCIAADSEPSPALPAMARTPPAGMHPLPCRGGQHRGCGFAGVGGGSGWLVRGPISQRGSSRRPADGWKGLNCSDKQRAGRGGGFIRADSGRINPPRPQGGSEGPVLWCGGACKERPPRLGLAPHGPHQHRAPSSSAPRLATLGPVCTCTQPGCTRESFLVGKRSRACKPIQPPVSLPPPPVSAPGSW